MSLSRVTTLFVSICWWWFIRFSIHILTPWNLRSFKTTLMCWWLSFLSVSRNRGSLEPMRRSPKFNMSPLHPREGHPHPPDLEISLSFPGRWATSASATVQLHPGFAVFPVLRCLWRAVSAVRPSGRAELAERGQQWQALGGVPPACNCLCAMLGEEASWAEAPRYPVTLHRDGGDRWALAKPLSLPPVKQSWEDSNTHPASNKASRKVLLSFPTSVNSGRGRRYLDTGDAERNCSSTLGWKSNLLLSSLLAKSTDVTCLHMKLRWPLESSRVNRICNSFS